MNWNPYARPENKRAFHLEVERALERQTAWFEGHLTCTVCGENLTDYVDDEDWQTGNYQPNHPDNGCVWRRLADALVGQLGLQYTPFAAPITREQQGIFVSRPDTLGESMGLSENLIVCPEPKS